jgi:hypothetical protein
MRFLDREQIEATGRWILAHQSGEGEIPWWRGEKADPWDHVFGAMGLTIAGFHEEAVKAFRFLEQTQSPDGAWPAWRKNGEVTDDTQDTNQAAFIATGAWYYYTATGDGAFLRDLWPTIERAIDFCVGMQADDGSISWGMAGDGGVWDSPLLTGSSSVFGSFVCAERIAAQLGYRRPDWSAARQRLGDALRENIDRFETADVAESPDRHSMNWYYPVLGGALRGEAGRARLLDADLSERFLTEGVGCRCVADAPDWHTVAETCELIIAFDSVGLDGRAQQIYSWMRGFRRQDGSYWTGKTHPDNIFWPVEPNTWTAAAILVANDTLAGDTVTSEFFRSLGDPEPVSTRRAIAS